MDGNNSNSDGEREQNSGDVKHNATPSAHPDGVATGGKTAELGNPSQVVGLTGTEPSNGGKLNGEQGGKDKESEPAPTPAIVGAASSRAFVNSASWTSAISGSSEAAVEKAKEVNGRDKDEGVSDENTTTAAGNGTGNGEGRIK